MSHVLLAALVLMEILVIHTTGNTGTSLQKMEELTLSQENGTLPSRPDSQTSLPRSARQAFSVSVVLPPWISRQLPSYNVRVTAMCPPLRDPSLELTCTYSGSSVSCDRPMFPGTLAVEQCKGFYKPDCKLAAYSLRCQQTGQWDYPLYHCTPGTQCNQQEAPELTWTRLSDCALPRGDLIFELPYDDCNLYNENPYVCCQAATRDKPVVNIPVPEERKSLKMCRRYAESVSTCSLVEPVEAPAPSGYNHVAEGPRNAEPREFPHMAVVGYGPRSHRRPGYRCTGSLVSERYVLSLARCARTQLGPVSWVRLGDYNVNSEQDDVTMESRTAFYDVIDVVVHAQYEERREPNTIFYHDIALFRLGSDVTFSDYVRPICLHSGDVGNTFVLNTGWGPVELGERPSDVVQKANVTVTPDRECRDAYKFYGDSGAQLNTDLVVCASLVNGHDTCTSIDGSALQVRLRDPPCMHGLVGVAYFGNACFVKTPGVYVRISYYLDWIESVVWP